MRTERIYNFNLFSFLIDSLEDQRSSMRALVALREQVGVDHRPSGARARSWFDLATALHHLDMGHVVEAQLRLSTIRDGLLGVIASAILARSLIRDAPKRAAALFRSAMGCLMRPKVITRDYVYTMRDLAVFAVHAGDYATAFSAFAFVGRHLAIGRLPAREQMLFCLPALRLRKSEIYGVVDEVTRGLVERSDLPVVEALFLRLEALVRFQLAREPIPLTADILAALTDRLDGMRRENPNRISSQDLVAAAKGLKALVNVIAAEYGHETDAIIEEVSLVRTVEGETAESMGCVVDIFSVEVESRPISVTTPDGFETTIAGHPLSDNHDRRNRILTMKDVDLANNDLILTPRGRTTEWLSNIPGRPFDALRTDRRSPVHPSLTLGPPGVFIGNLSAATRTIDEPCALLYRARHQWSWFGHWVIDSLTRVAVLRETGGWERFCYPCPPNMEAFQKDSLEFFGFPTDRLLPKAADERWRLGALSVVEFGSTPPFRHVQRLTAERLGERRVGSGQRLYLSRKRVPRRDIVNEEEVERLLADRFGFTVVYPETLSIVEQIQLFHGADVVVGPIGSALCSIVFARPGTKLVQIFTGLHGFASADLFRDLGIELYVMSADPVERTLVWHDAVLTVNTARLENLVERALAPRT